MSGRTNACSELTRFWLEARHGCLVTESVPVPVYRNQSDLDLVAVQSAMKRILLPGGIDVGPRLIVETKDEHDFDPKGQLFAKLVRADRAQLGNGVSIPALSVPKPKFSMLRHEHYQVATSLFGTEDFDRLFVVHALQPGLSDEETAYFARRRVFWLTIRDVVADIQIWYRAHPRPSGLRHSLMGDTLHLLFGYCELEVRD